MTSQDETFDEDELLERARAAVGPGIDRAFGEGSVARCLAAGFAEGIQSLRRDDGTLDPELVDSFLFWLDFDHKDQLVEWLIETEGTDDALEALAEAFEECDRDRYDGFISEFIGDTDEVAAIDPSVFASMTGGWIVLWVVRRNGELCTYYTGDSEACSTYWMQDAGREADDPDLRAVRLEFARSHGGYGPGMAIDTQGIDDELREMTMSGSFADYCWHYVIGDHSVVPELVDSHLPAYTTLIGQDNDEARPRLTRLFETGQPNSDLENRFLREVWKEERPVGI